jgi:sucrose-6-phosphate hydrolase SacC (GH32 family)
MSWGHSVSDDLVNWSNVPPKGQDDSVPALAPDMDYDKDGVFTGCWCPVDVGTTIPALSGREDALGVYYTSGQQGGNVPYRGQKSSLT